ncbi:MAG: FAD-binding protein [Proteobacteria bacterium]|nr:FAD-binding protein [Pseudomonadota bacterium]
MKTGTCDIMIVGAGPVGLMCAYLSKICGLSFVIADSSEGPLKEGRADALNARTLQLLELVGLFDGLYSRGKICNTSSVWSNGAFLSRQSAWWDDLEGCLHKHFLMLGQAHLEGLLDQKLHECGNAVHRHTSVLQIEQTDRGCTTFLSDGSVIHSSFVIGADGSRSFVRGLFGIPFEITRPRMVWAVVDGVISTDFPKVPEIIVFQNETSDVAWIPREGDLDRFYVRMDQDKFSQEEVLEKIGRAIRPHVLNFDTIVWFSQFSVKESVAERFAVGHRVFLAGDACHIHSVNGGQGLNTGIADAFNLIWKLKMVVHNGASVSLLESYENERKPVAKSVIESSGELVRSTKYSETGTHAQDYVKLVEKRSGNITGMGIRYGKSGVAGTRLFDFELMHREEKTRIYSLLDYSKYSLLVFGDVGELPSGSDYLQCLQISNHFGGGEIRAQSLPFDNVAVLVRPDSYIADVFPLTDLPAVFRNLEIENLIESLS